MPRVACLQTLSALTVLTAKPLCVDSALTDSVCGLSAAQTSLRLPCSAMLAEAVHSVVDIANQVRGA